MSAVAQRVDPGRVLAAMHALEDQLQALDLTGLGDDELLEFWREHERLRRRLPTGDHALILEAADRGLPERCGVRSMRGFLRGLLRLDPGEAHARVQAADAAARRRSFTGQMLPARYEPVAVAQAEGAIGERHARIVVHTLEHLPAAVRDQEGEQLAGQLVGHARRFDPAQLARLARRLADCLDPDGTLRDAAYRHRDATSPSGNAPTAPPPSPGN